MDRPVALWRRVFENRDLALLWFGQTVSMAGDSVYEKALLWLMLDLTGSSGITGLVAVSAYLPTLLVGVWAGVAVDRTDHRHLMLAADVARVLLVLVVPILFSIDLLTPWALFAITFLVATAAAFFNPARDAIIPRLVPNADRLLKANAIIQSSWMFALFVGPGTALVLLQVLGLRAVDLFYADSVTFLISFVCVYFVTNAAPIDFSGRRSRKVSEQAAEGLRYATEDIRVRWLLIITAADNLFIMGPALVGTVVFVREVLRSGLTSLMFIEACYAVGMVAGTLLLPVWQRFLNRGRILLVGMILDGITFVPLLWVRSVWGTGIVIIIHSLAIPMLVVTRPALVQQIVPPQLQGRVFSIIGVTVVGLTALSSGITGLAAEVVDMPVIFAVIGICASLCGAWGLSVKDLRES